MRSSEKGKPDLFDKQLSGGSQRDADPPQTAFSQQMQIPIIDLLLSEDIGVLDQVWALQ
jgi:hypothetical protein